MNYFANLAVHGAFFIAMVVVVPFFWSSIHHWFITVELPIYSIGPVINKHSCVAFISAARDRRET